MSEQGSLKRIHPGEIILEDFLKPWRMTSYRLAKGLGVTPTCVAEILKGKRAITAETALRLSRFLGCTPEFWLGLQAAYDLEVAAHRLGDELEQIQPYTHSGPVYLDDQATSPEPESADVAGAFEVVTQRMEMRMHAAGSDVADLLAAAVEARAALVREEFGELADE